MIMEMEWADAMLFLGGLAFLTAVITEVTKNLGFLKEIPTDLLVILLSVAGSLIASLYRAEMQGAAIGWTLFTSALVAGLLAAFIAMYGWATFYDLLARFLTDPGTRD